MSVDEDGVIEKDPAPPGLSVPFVLEEELDVLELDACECSSPGGSVYMYSRAKGYMYIVIGVHYLKYTYQRGWSLLSQQNRHCHQLVYVGYELGQRLPKINININDKLI